MGVLELLSKFDPFLAEHISRFGNKGRGTTSYLSSTICDELIERMGADVLSEICDEVRTAKYFALIVDFTPDSSHIDQLTFIIRYVDSKGDPKERFLKFLPILSHGDLQQCVLNTLEYLAIKIDDCRGQSYDNAANMFGKYAGLQARIKGLNPLADYIPCAAHSLNLVGVAAWKL